MSSRTKNLILSWLCLLALFCVTSGQPVPGQREPRGRVIVVSLDGLGHEIWTNDPAARQLRRLRRIAHSGVVADGVVQTFPTITPAGHAALWTGAHGNLSGIVTTNNPLLPRDHHTAFESRSGFDSRLLRAEPLWVTAARQGVRAVAHQATQSYPFIPFVTAPDSPAPPVLVTGYGPGILAPHAIIRASHVTFDESAEWSPALPWSDPPPRTFRWTTGQVTFHGALVSEGSGSRGYTSMYIAGDPKGPRVRVSPEDVEAGPPTDRDLARHFSDGLLLEVGPNRIPTAAYFRLYELSADGSDFMLYQPAVHELAIREPGGQWWAQVLAAREAGGFIGNSPSRLYRSGQLGLQVHSGGDGTAERRYLEGIELVTRQYNRLSSWLWHRYSPELLIDYLPYPDEMDHTFYGLARPDITGTRPEIASRFQEFRAWAYAVVDRRVELLDSLIGPSGHLIFSSDHGMSPVYKEVSVNAILRRAGLLHLDDGGDIDPSGTQAVHVKFFVLINTRDWKNGMVPIERRGELVDRVQSELAAVRDPESAIPVFLRFFRPEEHGSELGIGGPAGGDLYFELAPGYYPSDDPEAPVIRRVDVPYGAHGFLPTRPEMLSTLIARGPRLKSGVAIGRIRSVDVAPLVCDLLEIGPPAQATGRSPLRTR